MDKNKIIDTILSTMHDNASAAIFIDSIIESEFGIDDYDLEERIIIQLKEEGLASFNKNNVGARITSRGIEIVENGGWLKYLEREKKRTEFNSMKENTEILKLKDEIKLNKKKLEDYNLTRNISWFGAALAVILALIEIYRQFAND